MGTDRPKPLVEVAGVPLAERAIRQLIRAGVVEIAVVVGHRAREVMLGLRKATCGTPARLHFIENPDHHLPNGVSLRAATPFVHERTLLLMADHLFAPSMLSPLCEEAPGGDGVVLAVDRDLVSVYDLDDATKVRTSGNRITDIGKAVSPFDAVDTGLFVVSPLLCRAMAALEAPQLSDGVRELARRGLCSVTDVTGGRWIDVDTPRARRVAEGLIARFGEDLDGSQGVYAEPPAA